MLEGEYMDTIKGGIVLGLIFFVILLINIHIMRLYTDIADIIGGKVISFLRDIFRKIKRIYR